MSPPQQRSTGKTDLGDLDSTQVYSKEGPSLPISTGGCTTCPITSSAPCISGSWYNYPGTNARVGYTIALTNRCGTVTLGGTVFRPLNCPAGADPPIQLKYFYPNPADKELTIVGADAPAIGKMFLYDEFGNEMFAQYLDSEQNLTVNTSSWKEGKYFLQIDGEKLTVRDSLIVSHAGQLQTVPAKSYSYPNPADSNLLIVGADAPTTGDLYLMDAYGNTVIKAFLGAKELNLDTRRLPSGVYFLKIVGAKLTTNKRIMISHGEKR